MRMLFIAAIPLGVVGLAMLALFFWTIIVEEFIMEP